MVRSPKYRFHFDENVPASAARFLASLGHNCTDSLKLRHEKLIGASDYRQLRFAIKEQRVLLTFDRDFHQVHLGRLVQRSLGVITLKGEVTEKLLRKLLKAITPNKLEGKICRASIEQIHFVDPTTHA
jgi:predicted nuclease of predicted toxin-antitoxin system